MEGSGPKSREHQSSQRVRSHRTDSRVSSATGGDVQTHRRSQPQPGSGRDITFVAASGATIDRYISSNPVSYTPQAPATTYHGGSTPATVTSTPSSQHRAGSTAESITHQAPATVANIHTSESDELRKKKLPHKDVRPGMCVWVENHELEFLGQYFGKQLLSKAKRHTGAKHPELVVEKSGHNDSVSHVKTVMLTTFGGAQSLRGRAVYENRWKECVPRYPAYPEGQGQYGPVTFEHGLRDEGIAPGWILVHKRNIVYPDRRGEVRTNVPCQQSLISSDSH